MRSSVTNWSRWLFTPLSSDLVRVPCITVWCECQAECNCSHFSADFNLLPLRGNCGFYLVCGNPVTVNPTPWLAALLTAAAPGWLCCAALWTLNAKKNGSVKALGVWQYKTRQEFLSIYLSNLRICNNLTGANLTYAFHHVFLDLCVQFWPAWGAMATLQLVSLP